MFIEPTITWVPSEFSGYIWLDVKIVFKKKPRPISCDTAIRSSYNSYSFLLQLVVYSGVRPPKRVYIS